MIGHKRISGLAVLVLMINVAGCNRSQRVTEWTYEQVVDLVKHDPDYSRLTQVLGAGEVCEWGITANLVLEDASFMFLFSSNTDTKYYNFESCSLNMDMNEQPINMIIKEVGESGSQLVWSRALSEQSNRIQMESALKGINQKTVTAIQQATDSGNANFFTMKRLLPGLEWQNAQFWVVYDTPWLEMEKLRVVMDYRVHDERLHIQGATVSVVLAFSPRPGGEEVVIIYPSYTSSQQVNPAVDAARRH